MTLLEDDDGTTVVWGFMDYPMNLLMPFMDLDGLVGKDFDTGLANLKAILDGLCFFYGAVNDAATNLRLYRRLQSLLPLLRAAKGPTRYSHVRPTPAFPAFQDRPLPEPG